jgi:hypothetical protein
MDHYGPCYPTASKDVRLPCPSRARPRRVPARPAS